MNRICWLTRVPLALLTDPPMPHAVLRGLAARRRLLPGHLRPVRRRRLRRQPARRQLHLRAAGCVGQGAGAVGKGGMRGSGSGQAGTNACTAHHLQTCTCIPNNAPTAVLRAVDELRQLLRRILRPLLGRRRRRWVLGGGGNGWGAAFARHCLAPLGGTSQTPLHTKCFNRPAACPCLPPAAVAGVESVEPEGASTPACGEAVCLGPLPDQLQLMVGIPQPPHPPPMSPSPLAPSPCLAQWTWPRPAASPAPSSRPGACATRSTAPPSAPQHVRAGGWEVAGAAGGEQGWEKGAELLTVFRAASTAATEPHCSHQSRPSPWLVVLPHTGGRCTPDASNTPCDDMPTPDARPCAVVRPAAMPATPARWMMRLPCSCGCNRHSLHWAAAHACAIALPPCHSIPALPRPLCCRPWRRAGAPARTCSRAATAAPAAGTASWRAPPACRRWLATTSPPQASAATGTGLCMPWASSAGCRLGSELQRRWRSCAQLQTLSESERTVCACPLATPCRWSDVHGAAAGHEELGGEGRAGAVPAAWMACHTLPAFSAAAPPSTWQG